jgi:hypothetical protein
MADYEHASRGIVVPYHDVTATFAAAATATVRHGMGRRYDWAAIKGQRTTSGTARAVFAATPAETEAQGYDATVYVLLLTDAGASYTGTVDVRVYAA